MQHFVIDLSRKNLLIIEEMRFLPVGQHDLRMLLQEIMQGCRAGLLRAGHNEIEPLDLSLFNSKHEINRACAVAPCPRDKFCNLRKRAVVLEIDGARTCKVRVGRAHDC